MAMACPLACMWPAPNPMRANWRKRPWPPSVCRRNVADKAYDSHELRQRLRRRGIKPTIPTFERRQPKRGRPIKPGASYRQRWTR
jgi:hypothetical protein